CALHPLRRGVAFPGRRQTPPASVARPISPLTCLPRRGTSDACWTACDTSPRRCRPPAVPQRPLRPIASSPSSDCVSVHATALRPRESELLDLRSGRASPPREAIAALSPSPEVFLNEPPGWRSFAASVCLLQREALHRALGRGPRKNRTGRSSHP